MAQDDTPSDRPDAKGSAESADDKTSGGWQDSPRDEAQQEPQQEERNALRTGSQDRGTFLPLVFGGAVAAALGFFGSQIDSVERALGLAPPDDGLQQVVDAQAATIAEQQERISALAEEVDNLPAPPPPPDLSGIEDELAGLSTQLDELAERVEEVEKRPMTDNVSREAIAAYEKELERLQSAVVEQRAEIEALLTEARKTESEAERQARLAQARAVTAKIITAVENGASFAADLAKLQEAGGGEVPEVLVATAAEGVATLSELQARFPDVARAALTAAREEEAASGQGGFGAFLERQLGARSVTPQDGDDPDAVLSRAEAAVREGRLGVALTEIDALPDKARNAMGNWIAQAETRHDAVRAAQALMTALATN